MTTLEHKAPMTLEQRVKDRIDVALGELFPEDELQRKVEQTIAHMREKELPKLIQDAVRDAMKAAISAEMAKPEWQQTWTQYGTNGASEAMRKVMIEAAPQILAALLDGVAVNITQQIRQSLQRPY